MARLLSGMPDSDAALTHARELLEPRAGRESRLYGSKPVTDRIKARDADIPDADNSNDTTKHIFVTGGVVSSLGKGLTAASLGNLLTARGLRVVMQKLDPYLNVDPGTMNPFQHGEVFVTDDGAETDLDIGHYERFLDIDLSQAANVTTGQIYSQVIAQRAPRRVPRRHRAGHPAHHRRDQAPHAPAGRRGRRSPTSSSPRSAARSATSSRSRSSSRPARSATSSAAQNVFFVHVSLVPFMGASGEQKTKPTQHSVATLRSIGIQPDALVLRSDRPVTESNKRKIALMCDVDEDAVVNAVDVPSIYDIPTMLNEQGLDEYIVAHARPRRRPSEVDWSRWQRVLQAVHNPKHEVTIGLVGKYIDLPDAYLSVTEALKAGGFAQETQGQRSAGSRPTSARRRRARAKALGDARRHRRARRIRHPRHRGQARRAEVRARAGHPDPRPVPRPAVHGHRVRPPRRRHRRRVVERVRPRHRSTR